MIEIYIAGAALSWGFAYAMVSSEKALPIGLFNKLSFLIILTLTSWVGFGFLLASFLIDIYDKLYP